MSDVTYIFRDGKTFAIRQGKVIAASTDPDEVQALVKKAWMDGGYAEEPYPSGPPNMDPNAGGSNMQHGAEERCPECGGFAIDENGRCLDCGARLPGAGGNPWEGYQPSDHGPMESDPYDSEFPPSVASVTTPNGLKGTVLGKVASLWGDEVTIRLENGRIVKLPVGTELRSVKTAAAKRVSPIEQLEARLARTSDGTRQSLVSRHKELERIHKQASTLIREGVSYADSLRLDQLAVTADVERAEVIDAIAHIDAAESYTPPSFTMQAADRTSSVSREDASWLDHTLDEMVKEAEATDFNKLMDEGPEALTAGLEVSALADSDVTREIASSFIAEKTAGIERKLANPYMKTFLNRVEGCRKSELDTRTQTTPKEAAVEKDEFKDFPDDALFL